MLGSGKKTVGFAPSPLTWTDKITLITGGEAGDMTADHRTLLASFNIAGRDQSIAALEREKGSKHINRILLSDNNSLECDALFFNLGTELAELLMLSLLELS